jgi:flagellar hook-associated protein 1 FlgK
VAALQDDTLVARADSIVDQVARDVDAANTRAQTTSASQTMFLDAVDAVSGVSVDEEMMHMLEIQRAYQGSAKVISTVDQMLATVLNTI